MEFTASQQIVQKLKEVKEKNNLTITQIKAMVDATGAYLSESTIRRVFATNSETELNFNYEQTIKPIAQALLNNDLTESEAEKSKRETFLTIIKYKDEQIESLHKQVSEQATAYEARCHEYEQRMAFLRDQIELKDTRMDRKDATIEKLLDQLLVCKDCAKCK